MKHLITFYIIAFTLTSCGSIHFKDISLEEGDDVDFHGNVQKVTSYEILNNSKSDSTKVELYFERNGKLHKQIDFYKSSHETTTFKYDNKDRLVEHISNSDDQLTYKFVYDKRDNQINSQAFYNGEISSEIRTVFDKKNNKVLEVRLKKDKPADTCSFMNDYHKRIQIANYSKSGKQLISHFDKRGNRIIIESATTTLKYEYDSRNRITRKSAYDKSGKLRFENTYLNKYDRLGNLKETLVIVDGKPFKRLKLIIDYY